MARPDSLIPGNCYFRVTFYDEDLLVPDIGTWIYAEKTSDPNGRDLWLFRKPNDSGSSEEDLESLAVDEDQVYKILDIHELQKVLAEIEDLHPIVQGSEKNATELRQIGPDFSELEHEIAHFLKEKNINALTITIKHTPNGLSLIKEASGIEAFLSIRCKIHPEIERRARAFFQERKFAPARDYLADRGRVRVLTYSLPEEEAAIIEIVADTFKQIYDLAKGDQFKFRHRLSSSVK